MLGVRHTYLENGINARVKTWIEEEMDLEHLQTSFLLLALLLLVAEFSDVCV